MEATYDAGVATLIETGETVCQQPEFAPPSPPPMVDSTEEKRVRRMRRNRESAAASRKRTKEYIEELEGKVLALESTVQALQSENLALRAHAGIGAPVAQISSAPGSPAGPAAKRPKENPATPRVALVSLDQQPENGGAVVGTPTRHAETLLVFAQHGEQSASGATQAAPISVQYAPQEMVAVQQ